VTDSERLLGSLALHELGRRRTGSFERQDGGGPVPVVLRHACHDVPEYGCSSSCEEVAVRAKQGHSVAELLAWRRGVQSPTRTARPVVKPGQGMPVAGLH
jgi:hypothetical protein